MSPAPLLFNPIRASREELEATLVARQPLLDTLTDGLLADAKKKTRRHWLIVGPRGSGKSHLTELLARRLATEHGWSVARLPEEHYQISSVGELLEQVILRIEDLDESPLVDVTNPKDLEDAALSRIRAWKRQRGAPILVVLENLGSLFDRKLRDRRDQSRLRQILMKDPPFILVATATSYVDATVKHDAPFYDFFETKTLEDLSVDEVAALVEARARWDADELLLSRLDTVKNRVHALYHFSGGNPRLVVALYTILRQGVSEELHAQLLKLLDEVTPYYQARLGDISPQMERILAEFALAGGVLTPADVARRCRMAVNHVTANIAKLQAERFLRPSGRPDGRRRYYDVTDRLFRLWIQMRQDRGAPRRLRFLTEFFQRWYEGHPDEASDAVSRVVEAFWQDVEQGRDRWRDRVATLEYLQVAAPESSSLLTALELGSPLLTNTRAEQWIQSLQPLSSDDRPEIRATAAALISQSQEYLGRYDAALTTVVAADAAEVSAALRCRLWQIRISCLHKCDSMRLGAEIDEALALSNQAGFEPLAAFLGLVLVGRGQEEDALRLFAARAPTMKVGQAEGFLWRVASALAVRRDIHSLQRLASLAAMTGRFNETTMRAVTALSDPNRTTRERCDMALRCWEQLREVPSPLLSALTVLLGESADSVDLVLELIRRGGAHDAFVRSLLSALVDAVTTERIEALRVLTWLESNVACADLQTAFVHLAPWLRRRHRASALVQTYRLLRDRGLVAADVLPYSAAIEVLDDAAKLAALAPEVKEAVQLLIADPGAPTAEA